MRGCLSDDEAAALVGAELDPRERWTLHHHLDACADCRRLVSALSAAGEPTDGEAGELAAGEPTDGEAAEPAAAAELEAGGRLGRFVLVRPLGEGTMGAVWAAHDPELDREVAVKLLRLWPGALDGDAAARMRREAQAMARLTHANAVRIYELGSDAAGRVFCAMELVDGQTLRQWLATPRPPAQILEVLLAIGRGVAAAHAAGLIHRDIKPENVLMTRDDRPLVSDFGLAKLAELGDEGGAAQPVGDLSLTMSGTLVGTPAYMAPEQLAAQPTDARSDQFAYCVLAWEALFGERPFAGATLDALAQSIARGPARLPTRRGVPRAVTRALLLGLAVDPAARWPSLQVLVDELARATRRSRLVLGGIGAGVLAAAFAVFALAPRGTRCEDGVRLIAPIWNPAISAAQTARFVQLAPDARAAAHTATRLVDDWAAAWKLGRASACTVDEPARGARVDCLDRDLHDLRAQLAVWQGADRGVLETAVAAAAGLPDLATCTASRAGRGSPVLAEMIGQLDALVRSGRTADARARVPAVVALAEATRDPRDLALALISAGRAELAAELLPAARDHFVRAAREAGRAGDDAAMLTALLGETAAITALGQPLVALGVADAALAIDERTGSRAHTAVLVARAEALQQAGKIDEAIATLRAILPAVEAEAPRGEHERRQLARLLNTLTAALRQREDYAEAHQVGLRLVALDEAALGPVHPDVAADLLQVASCERRMQRFADAKAHLARAHRIASGVFGEHGVLVGSLDLLDAEIATFEDRFEDQLAALEHAHAAFANVLPPDHPRFAVIEISLGETLRAADRCRDAIPHFERAIHIAEHSGRDPQSHANFLVDLGACLIDVGRPDEGRNALTRALAELDDLHVARRWYSEPYAALADLEYAAGRRAAAIRLEEQALAAIADDHDSDTILLRQYEQERLAAWRAGK